MNLSDSNRRLPRKGGDPGATSAGGTPRSGPPPSRGTRLKILSLGVFAALTVAGCGLRGDLVRPVPLFGNPPIEGPNDPRVLKEQEEKAKAAKQREEAEERAQQAQPAPSPPQ